MDFYIDGMESGGIAATYDGPSYPVANHILPQSMAWWKISHISLVLYTIVVILISDV